jgi:hypothetical protein
MPTGSQDKLAHCRGVRRMHLRTNAPACVRAPGSHLRLICAWLIAMRKLSVCTFFYHSLGEPWAALRKTQVGNKRMKECRIFGMLHFSKR